MEGILIGACLILSVVLLCAVCVLDTDRDDCKNGAPRIIDHKVYRCVESK